MGNNFFGFSRSSNKEDDVHLDKGLAKLNDPARRRYRAPEHPLDKVEPGEVKPVVSKPYQARGSE